MKKHLLVFGLIFAMFSSFAQGTDAENNNGNADTTGVEAPAFCPHRINLEFGEGFTNNIYNRVGLTQYYSHSTSLNLSYAYFFNQHWGISIGAGLNRLSAKTSLSGDGIVANVNDPEFGAHVGYNTAYDLHYSLSGLVEKQEIWAVEVPLKAQFQWKFGDGRNGLFAGLGLVGYFPFKACNRYVGQGNLTTYGLEDLYNQTYHNTHFGEYEFDAKDNKDVEHIRCSFGVDFDFGGIFQISPKADFYLGFYVKSNFLDILPKDTFKTPLLVDNEFTGTLGSNLLNEMAMKEDYKDIRTKWAPVQIGLKAGFQMKACCTPAEKSRKDIEKEILEELKKKTNEPIIIKQDPQYIYIVPVCDQLEEDENGLTAEDRENLQNTVNALSNIKILFDLDKDDPKLKPSDNRYINDAVHYLKKDNNIQVIVKGYTCDLGSDAYNRDLAERRAIAVRNIFIEKGVNPSQVVTESFTANDPQNKIDIPEKDRTEHRAVILEVKNLKSR